MPKVSAKALPGVPWGRAPAAAGAAALGAAAGAAVAAAAGAPPFSAASMSDLTIRPCGPEPLSCARSMPACCAMRRARGEAKTRPSDPEAGAGAAAGAAAGVGAAAGAGAGLGAGASLPLAPAVPLPPGAAGAFACAAPTSISPALSPSSSRMAITALTATASVPSPTTILPTLPSSTASTSIVALSVSISAITSPEATSSPSLTCHLAKVPSVMVGESAGISTLIGMTLPVPPRTRDGQPSSCGTAAGQSR